MYRTILKKKHLKAQTHTNNIYKTEQLKKKIWNIHVYINILFYCSFCDKEVENDLKKHRGFGRLVQTHTINNPNFSDMNKIFYDIVLIHNKKFESSTIFLTIELDNISNTTFKTIDC